MFGYKFGKVDTPVIVTTTETLFFVSRTLYDYISNQPTGVFVKTANDGAINIRCDTSFGRDHWTVTGKVIHLDLPKMWQGADVHVEVQSSEKDSIVANYELIRDAFLTIVTEYRARSAMFRSKLNYTDTHTTALQEPLFGHFQSKTTGATIETKNLATLYVSAELYKFLETQANCTFTAKNGIELRASNSTTYNNTVFSMKEGTWCGKTVNLHTTDLLLSSITGALIKDFEKIKDAFLEAVEVCKNAKKPDHESLVMV